MMNDKNEGQGELWEHRDEHPGFAGEGMISPLKCLLNKTPTGAYQKVKTIFLNSFDPKNVTCEHAKSLQSYPTLSDLMD